MARRDCGRKLLGGMNPVKKPGPGEAADSSVAALSGDPVYEVDFIRFPVLRLTIQEVDHVKQ